MLLVDCLSGLKSTNYSGFPYDVRWRVLLRTAAAPSSLIIQSS